MAENISVVLQHARQALKAAGVDSFALDAELLLREALSLSREALVRDPGRIVSGAPYLCYQAMLARRIRHEPVAYILGKKEFYGRDFTVNKATLIPRPDSETLIDAVLKYAPKPRDGFRMVDFGTGSGCLLLTLLAEMQGVTGVGVDISAEAIAVAEENAQKLGLANRVKFRINSWQEEGEEAFDIVIANPPYIKRDDVSNLHPGVFLFEPHAALDGGNDGLVCYRQLAERQTQWLKPGGMLFLECGLDQHNDVVEIFARHGLQLVTIEKDLSGISRCIVMN